MTLPAALAATADADEALDGADAVVLALPAQRLRENLERWTGHLPRGVTLVSLAKGVERGSLLRMSEVIREVTGAAADEVAVVSGPNLAGEIAARAAHRHRRRLLRPRARRGVQHACSTGYFKPYTNADVIGCELGGACKNVIALACGTAAGPRLRRQHHGLAHHPRAWPRSRGWRWRWAPSS